MLYAYTFEQSKRLKGSDMFSFLKFYIIASPLTFCRLTKSNLRVA